MFGALNRFIARLDSDSPSQNLNGGHGAFGFQVLRTKNPEIPIEPWYDFIIGINGRQIDDPDPTLFATEVRNCAGSAGQRTRILTLSVPHSLLLGLTLQWTPLSSTEDVWHILDVIPSSPADAAGLLPYGDYIIGTPEGLVHGEAGLGELVEDHLSRPLRLYVYNHEYSVTRLVTITPSRNWGGSGALGCVLGFGALHRLPLPLTEPPAGPGETLFETARFSNEEARPSSTNSRPFSPSSDTTNPLYAQPPSQQHSSDLLVPASMISPPPPPLTTTSPAPPRSTRKARHPVSPNRAFDEYFKEGEQKSKEEDFVPSAKAATAMPPPPKAGGGPPKTKTPGPEGEGEGNI
ncbi:hypothetical protein MMC08_000749 [Hypocenomyce scalaris]|nr:hypothetical protein [Hypocenomyce scalaris]